MAKKKDIDPKYLGTGGAAKAGKALKDRKKKRQSLLDMVRKARKGK